ncbi:hypothetical protein IB241_15890 [Pseudomonas sp. PDM05]|uniref:hypothetical protein n=1 Tax=Pseudomonas sp. PDM05 TaxID=2769301 RepID=UPI001783B06D|nr:hypothetical protein [Pseudomonas sp. PDM05]MBD9459164.1 hypothetical protein [Pseudomonas sp. PDM05]
MQFVMKLAGCVGIVFLITQGVSRCSGGEENPKIVTKPFINETQLISALQAKDDSAPESLLSDEGIATADEGSECYSDVSPKLRSLIDDIRACEVENALGNHDSSALKIIPARGYKNGAAGVFKKYRLHVNQNADVTCRDEPWPDTGAAGCKVGVYVSRIRASNQYSDSAGWTAVWFRGVNDSSFRPVSPFAEHISTVNDSILRVGGLMDVSDRP